MLDMYITCKISGGRDDVRSPAFKNRTGAGEGDFDFFRHFHCCGLQCRDEGSRMNKFLQWKALHVFATELTSTLSKCTRLGISLGKMMPELCGDMIDIILQSLLPLLIALLSSSYVKEVERLCCAF